MQFAMRRADPPTTLRYDMARATLGRHAVAASRQHAQWLSPEAACSRSKNLMGLHRAGSVSVVSESAGG